VQDVLQQHAAALGQLDGDAFEPHELLPTAAALMRLLRVSAPFGCGGSRMQLLCRSLAAAAVHTPCCLPAHRHPLTSRRRWRACTPRARQACCSCSATLTGCVTHERAQGWCWECATVCTLPFPHTCTRAWHPLPHSTGLSWSSGCTRPSRRTPQTRHARRR
jgi:hypothetical protein